MSWLEIRRTRNRHANKGDSLMIVKVRSWLGRAAARRQFNKDLKQFSRIWAERAARLQP